MDIVERLKRLSKSDPEWDLYPTAIGEIERLRAELARVEGQRNASYRYIEKLRDELAAALVREWVSTQRNDIPVTGKEFAAAIQTLGDENDQ